MTIELDMRLCRRTIEFELFSVSKPAHSELACIDRTRPTPRFADLDRFARDKLRTLRGIPGQPLVQRRVGRLLGGHFLPFNPLVNCVWVHAQMRCDFFD